jgi:hypothetical protein
MPTCGLDHRVGWESNKGGTLQAVENDVTIIVRPISFKPHVQLLKNLPGGRIPGLGHSYNALKSVILEAVPQALSPDFSCKTLSPIRLVQEVNQLRFTFQASKSTVPNQFPGRFFDHSQAAKPVLVVVPQYAMQRKPGLFH